VLEKYPKKVKLIIKHFPLPNHPYSRQAAIAALAAGRQEKFWEFHEMIHQSSAGLSDAKLLAIAQELGLKMDQFKQDLNDPAISSLISRDLNNGRQTDVRGTPTTFVNGRLLRNPSVQGFEQMIEAELRRKK
jgi:protein-disulfide isomerase